VICAENRSGIRRTESIPQACDRIEENAADSITLLRIFVAANAVSVFLGSVSPIAEESFAETQTPEAAMRRYPPT
jgi:hypothetical protein